MLALSVFLIYDHVWWMIEQKPVEEPRLVLACSVKPPFIHCCVPVLLFVRSAWYIHLYYIYTRYLILVYHNVLVFVSCLFFFSFWMMCSLAEERAVFEKKVSALKANHEAELQAAAEKLERSSFDGNRAKMWEEGFLEISCISLFRELVFPCDLGVLYELLPCVCVRWACLRYRNYGSRL